MWVEHTSYLTSPERRQLLWPVSAPCNFYQKLSGIVHVFIFVGIFILARQFLETLQFPRRPCATQRNSSSSWKILASDIKIWWLQDFSVLWWLQTGDDDEFEFLSDSHRRCLIAVLAASHRRFHSICNSSQRKPNMLENISAMTLSIIKLTWTHYMCVSHKDILTCGVNRRGESTSVDIYSLAITFSFSWHV